MTERFRLFPEQASAGASQVDSLYFVLLAISGVVVVGVCGLIILFAVRYRCGSRASRAGARDSHIPLELTWSAVPLAILMTIFFWGATVYIEANQPPRDALELFVVGKQWMWKIWHPRADGEINELHVPVGRPVRLTMISEDVIHSFYIPAFRKKMDVLPDRYTTLWFKADRTGEYDLFCAEYCGTAHSEMIGRVVVMPKAEYARWLSSAAREPDAVVGQQLFTRFGCADCHRPGPEARGPSLAGLFGSVVPLADGSKTRADEAYLRRAILDPQTHVVAGYQPVMPTFRGQVGERGVYQIIEYLKTLSQSRPSGPAE